MTASRSNASCPRLPQTIHIFHNEIFIPFTSVLSYGPYNKPVKEVAKVKFILYRYYHFKMAEFMVSVKLGPNLIFGMNSLFDVRVLMLFRSRLASLSGDFLFRIPLGFFPA